MRRMLTTLLSIGPALAALDACDEPLPPARPVAPTAVSPGAPHFDCESWARANHVSGSPGADVVPVMCAESPHLPGLWLVQSPNGGSTLTLAVVDGKPVHGGGSVVASFFRNVAIWSQPVTADDVGGVLNAIGAYPPGFTNRSPATFQPPFLYTLTAPLADWQGHGGMNSVAGAAPAGPQVRATLTTGPDAPTQWVIESGSGSTWSPTATIKWDKGPPEGPLR